MELDASTPAVSNSDYIGTQTASRASNPFSPPAGSVIVVTSWAKDSYQNDWAGGYPTITDSLASHLTWTPVNAPVYSTTVGGDRIGVWWAYTADAQTGMTVTIGESVTAGQYLAELSVAVNVWKDANTSAPVGAVVAANNGSGATLSVNITPEAVGSVLMLAAGNGAQAASSAGAGCYAKDIPDVATGGLSEWKGTSAGPDLTADTSQQTLTATASASQTWEYICYEILAAAGTDSGPNAAGAGADLGDGDGTWTGPGNITADDASPAVWTMP